MIAREMLPLIAALPAVSARRAVRALLAADGGEAVSRKPEVGSESLADFSTRARAAFESDMQPVVTALVSALHADNPTAWRELQGLLPALLKKVNLAPSLEALLALQLGTAFLQGLTKGNKENEGGAA